MLFRVSVDVKEGVVGRAVLTPVDERQKERFCQEEDPFAFDAFPFSFGSVKGFQDEVGHSICQAPYHFKIWNTGSIPLCCPPSTFLSVKRHSLPLGRNLSQNVANLSPCVMPFDSKSYTESAASVSALSAVIADTERSTSTSPASAKLLRTATPQEPPLPPLPSPARLPCAAHSLRRTLVNSMASLSGAHVRREKRRRAEERSRRNMAAAAAAAHCRPSVRWHRLRKNERRNERTMARIKLDSAKRMTTSRTDGLTDGRTDGRKEDDFPQTRRTRFSRARAGAGGRVGAVVAGSFAAAPAKRDAMAHYVPPPTYLSGEARLVTHNTVRRSAVPIICRSLSLSLALSFLRGNDHC